jgi:amidohydrolase
MDTLITPFHDWLVQLRRHFHQYPELSYQETETAAKTAEVLQELNVPFETGVGQTGIVAYLRAQKPGPTLIFRSDMDALPLEEANEVPYRSRCPGVMHACGHDAHITIALGVIRWLVDMGWPQKGFGQILFFFQPAEEGGAGAKAMLETGILDQEKIKGVFAGHMHPELPVGHIGISPEVSNAASDIFSLRIKGKGGHGAHPHLCVDPIVAGAHLVTQLQSIVSRNVPPLEAAVLSIGKFQAGTTSNVIPQEAVMEGTLRTLRSETRQLAIDRLNQLVRGLETSFGCSVEFQLTPGYPLLRNDPELAQWTVDQMHEFLGTESVHLEPPRMGAEDFAYFLKRYPGVMLRLGCHDPQKGYSYGLHSPYFDLDEKVLDVGVRIFAHLLIRYAHC